MSAVALRVEAPAAEERRVDALRGVLDPREAERRGMGATCRMVGRALREIGRPRIRIL